MFPDIDKKTKKYSLGFLFACYFLYLISISIKMVYSSEMAEIISAVGSDKSSVSLGLLFYYAAYSAAQLIFSFIISRVDLKWFITFTVSLTGVSFAMMLFASELWHLYLILFLNGFLQVGVWGGIMFFVGRYIPARMSGFASKLLATGLSVGTALTYGASALFIAFANWRYTFLFFSILTGVSVIIFLIALRSASQNLGFVFAEKLEAIKLVKNEEISKSDVNITDKKHGVIFMVAFFAVVLTMNSCLYYAIMGWFPSLLIENFAMPTKYSILITLLLPLCTTPSSFIIISFNQKTKSDYTALLVFIAAIVSSLLLLVFTYSVNMILTIMLAVLTLFCLRGMMSLLGVFFPLKYANKIESGKFSLILNAFSSLAGGVMPYTISFVLEKTSWKVYFIILCAFSVTILMLLFAARIAEIRKNMIGIK